MEVDSSSTTSSGTTTIAGLSVIAQVAHQIISDQEKNEGVQKQPPVVQQSDTPPQTPTPPQPPPLPPSNLDLNSLICLADVSEKMDSTPVAGSETSSVTKDDPVEMKSIQQPQPMDQS